MNGYLVFRTFSLDKMVRYEVGAVGWDEGTRSSGFPRFGVDDAPPPQNEWILSVLGILASTERGLEHSGKNLRHGPLVTVLAILWENSICI